MRHYKLGFRNRTASEQLQICERLFAGFANLPEVERNSPQYLRTQAAAAALRTSSSRIASLRAELSAELSRHKQLLADLRREATHSALQVSIQVAAEPAKLVAIGLDLAAPKTVRHGRCVAPESFQAEAHALEGVVKLRWKHPTRHCVFGIESRPETSGEKDWKQCKTCVQRSCLIKELTPGQKYWFRVRAINAHGEGVWSNPVSVRVR